MPLKDTQRILKPEAKPHEFYNSDGTARSLPIFVDPLTQKETVDCNICRVAINKNHLARHQNSAKCVSGKDERWQIQNAERQRAEDTVRVFMGNGPHLQRQSENYILMFKLNCHNEILPRVL